MKQKLRQLFVWGGGFYLLNSLLVPWLLHWRAEPLLAQYESRLIPQVLEIPERYYTPALAPQAHKQDWALEYLRQALGFTHAYLSPTLSWDTRTIREILQERSGDCLEYTLLSYNVFLILLEQDQRSELHNFVRVAFGKVISPEAPWGMGHAWLEVNLDAEWIPLEATLDRWPPGEAFSRGNLQRWIALEHWLSPQRTQFLATNTWQVKRHGHIEAHLSSEVALGDYRGLLGAMVGNLPQTAWGIALNSYLPAWSLASSKPLAESPPHQRLAGLSPTEAQALQERALLNFAGLFKLLGASFL